MKFDTIVLRKTERGIEVDAKKRFPHEGGPETVFTREVDRVLVAGWVVDLNGEVALSADGPDDMCIDFRPEKTIANADETTEARIERDDDGGPDATIAHEQVI